MSAFGQCEQLEATGLAHASPLKWNWAYNTRGELTKAGEAARQWDYEYDTIGNRLRASSTGLQPVSLIYASNALNQYTSVSSASSVVKPEYDLDGNLLSDGKHTCAWDGESRLTKITQGNTEITNTFDHLQRRVRKTVRENGQVKSDTAFVYDGWNVIAELDLKNPSNTRTHVWGLDLSNTSQGAGGVGGLLAVNDLASQTSLHPAYDGNGNITAWFDKEAKLALSREYDAFGNIISETAPDNGAVKAKFGGLPYAFSTKPQDAETGWLYYGYRYYAPELGRWPGRDPVWDYASLAWQSVKSEKLKTINEQIAIFEQISVLFGQNERWSKARDKILMYKIEKETLSALGDGVNIYAFVGNNTSSNIDYLGGVPYYEQIWAPNIAGCNCVCIVSGDTSPTPFLLLGWWYSSYVDIVGRFELACMVGSVGLARFPCQELDNLYRFQGIPNPHP